VKVVLAGASGLIGAGLSRTLADAGHEVRTLVRRTPASPTEIEWHPERRELDAAKVEGIDAIVCLSGAGVGDHRWTTSYKQTILSSRVDPVATIAGTLETLSGCEGAPRTFIAASAVGYYGDTGDRVINESAPKGRGFLAEVCAAWEDAATPAVAARVRVAHLRTGLVLSASGGLLGRLVPILRLGIGGRLGSGKQYMPWISMTDELRAIRFLLENDDIRGPVNLTGPAPATNAEFTATLARLMHRPAVLPVPGFGLRIVLGEFAEDALAGQRALPAVLEGAGFAFAHPDLESALRAALPA
jgi:uncharacterized protein